MKYILLLSLWLVSPVMAYSQISLEDYRLAVLDYSYTLKMAQSDSNYAIESYNQYKTLYLPSLTLGGDFSQAIFSGTGSDGWNVALTPQISQTIYKGGYVRAEVQKSLAQMEVALLDEQYDVLDVTYNADYAYYYLQAMVSYCSVVEEYIAIIRSLKDVVDLRFAEGYISKSDVLMIDTRLLEAEYEMISMEQSYTIAKQSFNTLRGAPIDQSVELVGIAPDSVSIPLRASIDELLTTRPDYLASKLNISIAQSGVQLARSTYNPQITMGVSGLFMPNSALSTGNDEFTGSLFVKLSASIFHFGERRRAVGAAQTRVDYYDYTSLQLEDTISNEESSTWAKIVDSRAQMLSAERSLEIASENLEISTFSYSEGLSTILDVMQAQISWLQLYTNSISSEMNYLVAISAYNRIMGVR